MVCSIFIDVSFAFLEPSMTGGSFVHIATLQTYAALGQRFSSLQNSTVLPCVRYTTTRHVFIRSTELQDCMNLYLTASEHLACGSLLCTVHGQAVVILDLHPSTNIFALIRNSRRQPLCKILVALCLVKAIGNSQQLRTSKTIRRDTIS